VAPEPAGQAAGLEGWQFLSNYARKAIRNEELRHGKLADQEDLVQQVFVEWWEQVGTRDQAFAAVLNRDSPEHAALRKAVRRVLDHARYEQTRARRMAELRDQPATVKPEEQDWIDLRLDWEGRAGGAGPRERQLLELRRQGLTFEEIGTEMGLLKQRVCELYNAAVERLQERYGVA
jgi:DNA-directed RNA polymerase specialized sigma24 family protein